MRKTIIEKRNFPVRLIDKKLRFSFCRKILDFKELIAKSSWKGEYN